MTGERQNPVTALNTGVPFRASPRRTARQYGAWSDLRGALSARPTPRPFRAVHRVQIVRSTGMGVTEALGIGLHASSVQRATSGGWKYDGPCPDAGVGWTRVKKYRICSRQGPRVDYEYVAPNGKRFRSLVAAQKHSSQLAQDCTVACATCGSEECSPGNDIVICDGTCGLAFHQQYSRSKVLLLAAAHVDTHCATRLLRGCPLGPKGEPSRSSPSECHRRGCSGVSVRAYPCGASPPLDA